MAQSSRTDTVLPMNPAVLHSSIVRWALGLIVVWVVANEVVIFTESDYVDHPLFSWTAYYLVYLSAAVLLIARAVVEKGTARLGWALIATGLIAWFGGSAFYNLSLTAEDVFGTVGYLLYYPFVAAGLLFLLRHRQGLPGRRHLLDGAAAAALCAALLTGATLTPLERAGIPLDFTSFVDRSYPVLDSLLLGLCICAWALRGWHTDPVWTRLALGLSIVALADAGYLLQTALDFPVATTAFDPLWPLGTTVIGWAAIAPPAAPAHDTEEGVLRANAPVVLLATLVTMLVLAGVSRFSMVAVTFLGLSGLILILRVRHTLHENTRLVKSSQLDARTDALTGLGNRRALVDQLGKAAASGDQYTLVLFDLDGFKAYNDQFGHPAGDALLERTGRVLSRAAASDGWAFRLGGDEFCALLPGHWSGPQLQGVADAMAETRDDVRVTASQGSIWLPLDDGDPDAALALADRRMYASKRRFRHRGRSSRPEARSTAA